MRLTLEYTCVFRGTKIFFAWTLRIHGFTLVALSMHVIQKWMVILNMFKDMVFDNLEVRDHHHLSQKKKNQGSPRLVGPQTTFVTSPMRCPSSPT